MQLQEIERSDRLGPDSCIISNSIFNCCRYVYVCFAADLISGGERLFKIVMTLVILTFSLQWLLVLHIQGLADFTNTNTGF